MANHPLGLGSSSRPILAWLILLCASQLGILTTLADNRSIHCLKNEEAFHRLVLDNSRKTRRLSPTNKNDRIHHHLLLFSHPVKPIIATTNNIDKDQYTLPTNPQSIMSPRRGVKRRKRKRFNDLFEKGLPRSANAICSNSMVNDLADIPKKRLREYIVERCPGSPEIADALFWVAETHPNQLRTKELCETLEAVTLIGADINALLANSRGNAPGGDPAGTRRKGSMTIYDLACGHGLAGTLLAYRFPEVRVVCVDLERRPCWSTYREAFERFGDAVDGADAVTANLAFAEGDITNDNEEEASFRPKGGDYLVCLHGCNDLSPSVLEMAAEHRAGFAVMPCCLREGMLGVSTASSNRNWGIADDTARYALQVGYLAGKFGCAKVASISQFITNRFLIIMGDWPSDRPSSEDGSNNEDQRQ